MAGTTLGEALGEVTQLGEVLYWTKTIIGRNKNRVYAVYMHPRGRPARGYLKIMKILGRVNKN